MKTHSFVWTPGNIIYNVQCSCILKYLTSLCYSTYCRVHVHVHDCILTYCIVS